MSNKKTAQTEKTKPDNAALRSSCSPKMLPKSETFSPLNQAKLLLEEDPHLKKSFLYCLSSILKRWKKKEFILNLYNSTLLIRKKGKEKLLYLNSFTVKMLGKFKKKFCFSLVNVKIRQRKYIIGCEDQETLESWCKSIADLSKNLGLVGSEPHISLENENKASDIGEDAVMVTSNHDIGENLSKYDHFLSREDIMSPLKQANPMKIIYDTIPHLLMEQFMFITEIFEKNVDLKTIFPEKDNEEWELIYKEEFLEKNFKTFMNRKSKSRGFISINFIDKNDKEIFAELKDPEYNSLWDTSLFSVEFRHYNNGKTIRMNQIYKPYQNSLHYTEFEYLRYHGKLKNFCFLVAKTPNSQQGFEDKDPSFVFPHIQWNYAKLKSEKFQGKIAKNCMFLTTKANICTLIYEVDMTFTANPDENQRIVAEYLKNFRNLHKLIMPLYHLKEDSSANTSPSSLNKKKLGNSITNSNNYNYTNYVNLANNSNLSNNTPKKEEKKNNLLAPLYELPKKTTSEPNFSVLKKKKFEFHKGHADGYANAENMKVFYEYFKSNCHVLDSIAHKYTVGPLPPSNKFIESSETHGHFAYKKDYSRGKNGGLHYHNTELMAEQKKVILSLLKQAGSNLIHGRSIMNVSLPLEVFEPRSFLERLARSFGHAPVFLEKAGGIANVVEQMKYTVSFFLSSIVLCIQQEKPFNPILGETFQGRINGFPIYMEQVSHHPAITYYLMKGKNYWFCGSHEAVANLGANTLAAEQKGTPMVRFPINNTSICFKWPMFVIHGAAVGTRYLNFYSKAFAFEKTHGLLCEIVFNVNEIGGFSGLFQKKESYSIDEIGGAIYKVRPEIIEKVHTAKKHQKISIDPNDIVETLAKIKGEWTSYVEFDGKRYWDIERDKPYLLEYEENPLPSDCNYRDDVILMRMGNRPAAQVKKNEGENSQRYDKKLRENYQKSLKKIKKNK